MKLSVRLGLIVGFAALGTLVLMLIALHTMRSSMLADRQEHIRSTVNLAAKQVGTIVAREKSGALTRHEAQKLAKQAMSGLRDGDDYVFVLNMDGVVQVHADASREGKPVAQAKGPDGRTLMKVYLDALGKSDLTQVEILVKRPQGTELTPKLVGVARIPEWDWIVGYGLFIDDIDEGYKTYALRFGLIGLVVFAGVLALAFVMAQRVYRTLGGEPEEAAHLARAITSGDLTLHIQHKGTAGSLMESIQKMRDNLRHIVGHIQQNADSVGSASSSLSKQMNHINQASKQAADAASSTAAAIEELAVSIDHISQSSHETKTNAQHATRLAQEGQALVQHAGTQITNIAGQVADATALIGGLVERSREIGGIASVIKEIADQTNLLALNAAIEAARAGEQGRGFAVVADEVRKLAERTGQATDQITNMIQGIHNDTTRVVDGMSKVGPQVTAGVDMAKKAGDALRQITEATTVAHGNVSDVAAATTEQSQAGSSVARNVEQISSMLEESTQSVEAANENVMALEQLAENLRQSVTRFKT